MPEDPTPDPAPEPTPDPTPPAPPADAPTLTQAQADKIIEDRLARERKKYADYDEVKAELEQLKAASLSDQEKAVAEARTTASTETAQRFHERLFAAEVRATAAGRLADPELLSDPVVAQRLLGFEELPVAEDGTVDAGAVAKALDALLEAQPYLAPSNPTPPRPGSGEQGPRGATPGAQLTREDLKSLSPDEIVKAKADGRLNDLMGITT